MHVATADPEQPEQPAAQDPAGPSLFRAEALAAANQPLEQLDQLVRLTSRRTWLTVSGVLLLAVAAVLWGVIGKSSVMAEGTGVMLPTDGLSEISSLTAGVLRDLPPTVGDRVRAGQRIGRVTTANGATAAVTSLIDGVVVEVLAERGDVVGPSTPLLRVEATSDQLVAYTFMPVANGQLIKIGTPINVGVATAPSGQYGAIRGTVTAVSLLPVSTERLNFLAGESNTIVSLLESRGPALELQVELERADTPSGYRWTSGRGPDFTIAAGTILQPTIVLSRRSLVSRVFS